MLRGLLRLVLIVVILVAIGAFFIGYRWAEPDATVRVDERPVGTGGALPDIDTAKARETGAAVGETIAVGAGQAQRALTAAGLTAKIKSKMGLDDSIDAANIDVDTDGSVVTLTGRVETPAQKTRALQLARETDGVTSVVDRLRVDAR